MCKSVIATVVRSFCFCCIAVLLTSVVTAGDKPLLSEEIRQVIETQGVEAAKQRFAEIYPAQKDQYNFNTNSMFSLGTEYMQNADMEKGMAIMEMSSRLIQDQAIMSYGQGSGNSQTNPMMQHFAEQERIEKQRQEKLKQQAQQQNEIRMAKHFGTPRDDLERFTGIYADPKTGNKRRALWIMVSCDGYLVSGATWGDASPWWMKSSADNEFSYSDSFQSLNIEFETDADGIGKTIIHDLNFLPSPLVKSGPPPSEWGKCIENRMKEQHG